MNTMENKIKNIQADNYNYDRFKVEYFDFINFPGENIGDPLGNYTFEKPDGAKINIKDFKGRPLVIETGSITCPMYVKNIKQMNKLANKYKNALFVTIYVREAHPGEKTTGHKNINDKTKKAIELPRVEPENRLILIDDINGSFHKKFGALPNFSLVTDKSLNIIFRADWNNPELIEKVLDKQMSESDLKRDHYEPVKPSPWMAFRVTFRGGWLGFFDLFKSLPKLMKAHNSANEILSKNNKI